MTANSLTRRDAAGSHPVGGSQAEPISTTWTIQGAQIHIEVIDGQVFVNGDPVTQSSPHGTPFTPKNE